MSGDYSKPVVGGYMVKLMVPWIGTAFDQALENLKLEVESA